VALCWPLMVVSGCSSMLASHAPHARSRCARALTPSAYHHAGAIRQVATMKPLLPGHPYLGDIANSIANHFGLGGKLTAEDTDAYDAAVRQAIDDGHHK